MREENIATALELMNDGLKFFHDRGGWFWRYGGNESPHFPDEYTAVSDFCEHYVQWSNEE